MVIGVVGVGHLATAILAGLLRAGVPRGDLLLSPRGKARAFSEQEGVALAADNRDLVERSDIVLLAVRPAAAAEAVAGLPWRAGQVMISVCAGVLLEKLSVSPAHGVRAMPLTAAEINASPTACFPPHPVAVALLERLGPVVALQSEADFEVATVNAAVYGWAQHLIRVTTDWSAAQGPDAQTMRRLIALTFVAAGRLIAEKPDSMESLVAELVTPGGITELGLNILSVGDQPETWRRACAGVLARLTGKAPA
jgi:pyrroline-5-carboxylate reductase